MKWWRNWKVLREKRRITRRIERLTDVMNDRTCTFTGQHEIPGEINRLVQRYNELRYE